MRERLRQQLCQRCQAIQQTTEDTKQSPTTTGVVYGCTGNKLYLEQAARSAAVLRTTNYSGPIHIFVDSDMMSKCNQTTTALWKLKLTCRALSETPKVGFVAKLIALLESEFDITKHDARHGQVRYSKSNRGL